MNNKPVVIIGGGGHASVLIDILLRQKRDVIAIISPDDINGRKIFSGVRHLRSDNDILQFSPMQVELVNAVGVAPRSKLRQRINENYLSWGYHFATVIADNAIVSDYAEIMPGAQILTRAVIHPGTIIGSHSIINTGVIIEHDCKIGAYNFIAPGATLCGQVVTGENVFVGAGATVIPNLNIGDSGIVTAGAVLVGSLDPGKICYHSRMVIR
ncbi:acetyltransferase [Kosakonia sp. BYX6]|uniref:Acetyltransferase n=1 Tax=Kosakonia calanthes TaxID=3139408 RepID=A0ABZ3BB19_9ENTR